MWSRWRGNQRRLGDKATPNLGRNRAKPPETTIRSKRFKDERQLLFFNSGFPSGKYRFSSTKPTIFSGHLLSAIAEQQFQRILTRPIDNGEKERGFDLFPRIRPQNCFRSRHPLIILPCEAVLPIPFRNQNPHLDRGRAPHAHLKKGFGWFIRTAVQPREIGYFLCGLEATYSATAFSKKHDP